MSYTFLSRELLSVTQAMLSAAEEGDWKKVGRIEVERQAVLGKLDQAGINTADNESSATLITDNIQEALSLNNRMIDLGQKVRGQLLEKMGGVRQGRKAMKVYYGIR
jgi:Flagellar protein FliT